MEIKIVLQVLLALHYLNGQGEGQDVRDPSGLYRSDDSGQYQVDSSGNYNHKEEATDENPDDIVFKEGFGEDEQPEPPPSVPISLNPSVTLALLGK